jgi:predicted membrane protein
MNELENKIEERYGERPHHPHHRAHNASGRIWTGVFLLIIGLAALLKSYLIPTLPSWLFSWQMLLIVLGLFLGIRHNFRGGPWFVLLLVGSAFLLREFYPGLIDARYIWPIVLIAMGAFLIFKPRRRDWNWQEQKDAETTNVTTPLPPQDTYHDDDVLDSTSVFGGVKKTIFSKNFRGGEVVNIMGGAEINLSQSDIQGRVELEVTQIFGGTKLVVPPHWVVKPEMAAIFGGIDDKRALHNVTIDHSKVLILKGTSIFGGIDIRNF